MPIYDYQCNECGKTYDVFHKVREAIEDVVCPSCGATTHTRLISAPSFSMGSRSAKEPSCDGSACCGGACPVN